ncbi:DUF805 domain-containing protein [Roseibium sediminicola]|uniref:DUF805 domain-containing protein n=1 Tax=Roseibium sediminicola TaxID=2933272 RepID=A0ABT0H005_9HYPH|nr:DUF805 domain-containing protein [Roseibium sp. CAU 1639]
MNSFNWRTFLLSFGGRTPRSDYWLRFVLPFSGFILLVGMLANAMPEAEPILKSVFAVVLVAMVWPSLAVAVKRLHDRDKSAWWLLLLLIPIVGSIWWFVDGGCLRGTKGPNRYGNDPLNS